MLLIIGTRFLHIIAQTRFEHRLVRLRGKDESLHRSFSGQFITRDREDLEVVQDSGEEQEHAAPGKSFAETSPPACKDNVKRYGVMALRRRARWLSGDHYEFILEGTKFDLRPEYCPERLFRASRINAG